MYNLAIIVGRICATPELRTTPNGTSVCSFTVAVDRAFKNADGDRVTDFINCVAYRNNAEFISKFFHKGSPIGLQGNIQTRSYTDKEGNKRRVAEVVAENVYFGDSKKEETNSNSASNGGGYGGGFGGYPVPNENAYGGGGYPAPGSDFAALDDDDAQLPF